MRANSIQLLIGGLLGTILLSSSGEPQQPERRSDPPPEKSATAKLKQVEVGRNVWLETDGNHRRVVISAYVCLREGLLEQLMCRKNTKEHEAILAADVDARDIHKALLLTGAEPGSPVRYEPEYRIPSGSEITVTLEYEEHGRAQRVPAQTWVRNLQERKELNAAWVFAGSEIYPDPLDKKRPPIYGANSGDVICVSNFEDALLDVALKSSKDNSELAFEAWTERIPELDTKVTVVLEPTKEPRKSSR
jgi:hypothetical protein